jgi:hypothetical protein
MTDPFEIPLGDEQEPEDRFMLLEDALEIVLELAKGNALSMEEGFDVELWDEYKKQHLALDTVEDFISNNLSIGDEDSSESSNRYVFKKLMEHVGHELSCHTYEKDGIVANVTIACETCQEVLADQDNPDNEQLYD